MIDSKPQLFNSLAVLGNLSLFLTGLGVEFLNVVNLFSEFDMIPMTYQKLFLYHAGANLSTAWGLYGLLPQKYRSNGLKSYCYYCLIGLFMPILGALGLLIVHFFGIRQQKIIVPKETIWRIIGRALMPDKAPRNSQMLKFGAHGMLSRLQRSKDQKAQLGIVLATRTMQEQNAVPLLNLALKNPQDDVRLLAFTLLEQKSAAINASIERLEKSLATSPKKAKIHTAIAGNYLRLVTLGLIHDEMKHQMLNLAARHLDQALDENAAYRKVYFIQGQIFLAQGKIDRAESAFNRALELGYATVDVYPFLAQVAYRRREFRKIPKYLQLIPADRRKYEPLAKICAYWLPEESANLNPI